jgi:hypothetical protein
MTLFPGHGLSSAAMLRRRLFEMAHVHVGRSVDCLEGSLRDVLAPDWSVIALQQTRKVLAGLGVKHRVDGIGWCLMPPRWRGRTFDVFLLAVETRT